MELGRFVGQQIDACCDVEDPVEGAALDEHAENAALLHAQRVEHVEDHRERDERGELREDRGERAAMRAPR